MPRYQIPLLLLALLAALLSAHQSAATPPTAAAPGELRFDGIQFTAPVPDAISPAEVKKALKAFADKNNNKTLNLYVEQDDADLGLRVSCPIAVMCDRSYAYRAFKMHRHALYLYFSFDSAVVNNLTTEALKDGFSYVNHSIRFPELSSPTWRVSDGAFSPVLRKDDPRVTVHGIKDGHLKATITGEITSLEAERMDMDDCMNGETRGPCVITAPAKIPFVIHVDVALDPIGDLDCHREDLRDRCG